MSQAESKELVASILDDRLRPFLPLIYVVWSDDELSPNEFAGLCRVVAGYSGIDIDCQIALQHWLDPDDPPSPHELEVLRLRIADTETLNLPPNTSVTDLGPLSPSRHGSVPL